MTANTDEQIGRERRIVAALRSYRVAGMLLASAPSNDASHILRLIASGVSVVCLDRHVPGVPTDAVLLDNVRGARECVRHLIQFGHRSIAIITGHLKTQTAQERLQGYEEALREADIPVAGKLIFEGDFREESGYQLGRQLLERPTSATAVFVCNGVMTLGLLKAMEMEGVRCPEDLSLATFDDLTIDRTFHPHLTAVVQPGYEMGARAATILMDRIEGKMTGPPNSLRIVPTLVLRESSAMLPGAVTGRGGARRRATVQRP